MGDYPHLASQLMILFLVVVGGVAFWGACLVAAKLGTRDHA